MYIDQYFIEYRIYIYRERVKKMLIGLFNDEYREFKKFIEYKSKRH